MNTSIILILLWVALFASVYLLFRNKRVCDFGTRLINDAYGFETNPDTFDYCMRRADQITEKYSYDDFLFSFRPLRYEEWFDEDEIRFLTEHTL